MKRNSAFALRIATILIMIPGDLVLAWGISEIADRALTGDLICVLKCSAIIVAAVVVLKAADGLLLNAYKRVFSITKQEKKEEVYRIISSCSSLRENEQGVGDRKEQIDDDTETVSKYEFDAVPGAIAWALIAVIYSILIFRQGWPVFTVVVAMAILEIVPPIIVKKWLEKAYTECRDIEGEITDEYMSGVEGFGTLKVFGAGSWFESRIHALNKAYIPIGNRSILSAQTEGALYLLVKSVLKYGLYVVCGFMVMNRLLGLEGAITVIALSASFFAAMGAVTAVISDRAEYKAAKARLLKNGEQQEDAFLDSFKRVVFDDVGIENENDKILNGFSGVFGKDRKTLLKGENGSGKSTILRVVSGLKKPSKGTVGYIDAGGKSHEDPELNFPEDILFMQQEDIELPITAKELFDMADENKRVKITKLALDFELTDEELYKKKISELSGGERKKVFLAFALGNESRLLLADEPENSLDEKGLRLLFRELKEYRNAWVIVTHGDRMDSIADDVVRIEKGEVICE
ncbi:MAG: ATP-binding cassette domain-containing protein [Lachnospiraceae bacterium]|nr:ATP-binding cassette domain-containing protein [Lachnospiraceae bacterium]